MYLPQHFEETRLEVLHGLIRARPLATLVTMTEQGLEANHVPLEIDPEPAPFGTLRGHVARANPLWRQAIAAGTSAAGASAAGTIAAGTGAAVESLAVFQGADGYISPSWYPTKQRTGKVVPTWNYVVVHAYGPLRAVDDKEWLRSFVTRLTQRHESTRTVPWQVSDAPPDYIDSMLEAIVGIEMPLTRLSGKWKLSQNRVPADRAGVVEGLEKEPGETAAALAALVASAARKIEAE